ncbi:NifB/NifX family molybdenum-iron cluster-binding protein [Vibrio tritonius]|uniref:NifB/NifX family molybdenum-iron cluster-binding protein n=1 Tax=Vibrio tritonius TaxID=1435069 RepID=UPI00315DDF42
MKIAIPMKDEERISNHFAKATHYLVVDSKTQQQISIKTNTDQGCASKEQIIAWLQSEYVESVYVKDIGRHYWKKLTNAHFNTFRIARTIRTITEFWSGYENSVALTDTKQLKADQKEKQSKACCHQQTTSHPISDTKRPMLARLRKISAICQQKSTVTSCNTEKHCCGRHHG